MLQMSQVYVHWWKIFVKCWLSTVAVHLLHYNYFSDEKNLYSFEESNRISQNVNSKNTGVEFAEHGSLDSILRPCSYNILWNGPSPERALQMDAGKSAISFSDIRPVGQFSRFSIQTKTQNGKLKHIGSDSWRVLLRGPATVSPTTFDHGNGTYEFLFLVMDPGAYKLDITLDYSLCDGFRDPPKNWFIVGKMSEI